MNNGGYFYVIATPDGNKYSCQAKLHNYKHQPVADFIDDLIEDRREKIKRMQEWAEERK